MICAKLHGTVGKLKLDVNIEIPGRGVTSIYGRSAAGKTSFLRWVAGLEPCHKGYLCVNGSLWQDSDNKIFLPPHKRRVGYVFQEFSLFAHLNVAENIRLGENLRPSNAGAVFEEAANLLGLACLLKRFPQDLSGGEKQRVAMARALFMKPNVLLLDEPLASIDEQTKEEIFPYLEKIKKETDIPILFVSHNLPEIERFSDHFVELCAGLVVRSGSAKELLATFVKCSRSGSMAPPLFVVHQGPVSIETIKKLQSKGLKVVQVLVSGYLDAIGSKELYKSLLLNDIVFLIQNSVDGSANGSIDAQVLASIQEALA